MISTAFSGGIVRSAMPVWLPRLAATMRVLNAVVTASRSAADQRTGDVTVNPARPAEATAGS